MDNIASLTKWKRFLEKGTNRSLIGAISLTSVQGSNQRSIRDKLPESNVGNQLLKKMGWSGGGIGKMEQVCNYLYSSGFEVVLLSELSAGVSTNFREFGSRLQFKKCLIGKASEWQSVAVSLDSSLNA